MTASLTDLSPNKKEFRLLTDKIKELKSLTTFSGKFFFYHFCAKILYDSKNY